MIIVFRALLALLLVAFVVMLGGIGLSYYFVSRSLPDYDENFNLKNLHQPVEIIRSTMAFRIFLAFKMTMYFLR